MNLQRHIYQCFACGSAGNQLDLWAAAHQLSLPAAAVHLCRVTHTPVPRRLWPALDFTAMGFGVVPVGFEHDLSDDAVAFAFAEAAPRVAFATDAESASRLERLRAAGRLGGATVVGEGLGEEEGVWPLARVMDLAAILDTPERAQAFRAFSRRVAPEGPALWHAGPEGVARLTHQGAMARTAPALRARPALEGDVAYVDAPRVTLRKRLALAAFVGDGHTTTALGREGQAAEDVAALKPQKLLASEGWIEAACDGRGVGNLLERTGIGQRRGASRCWSSLRGFDREAEFIVAPR